MRSVATTVWHRDRSLDDVSELINGDRWPGNVRELRNCLEQILLLEDEPVISARHFHLRGRTAPTPPRVSGNIRAVTESDSLEVVVPEEGLALHAVEDASFAGSDLARH